MCFGYRHRARMIYKLASFAVGVTALVACHGCQLMSSYYTCHDGREIDPTKKSEAETSSLQFARALFSGDLEVAYSHFTEQAKNSTSRNQLRGLLEAMRPSGPYDSLETEQVMIVTRWWLASPGTGLAMCSKDLTHSEASVTVALTNVREQAYVLISAKGTPESWVVVLWLVPHEGQWQVQAFHLMMETAASKNAAEILAQARMERSRGHNLNAEVLYAGAADLASRGPFYRTGFQDTIQEEAQQIMMPTDFRGQPPFTLQGPSGPFTIWHMNPVPVRGQLYLLISQEISPWKDSGETVRKNRALISAFATRFPEYSDVFSGMVAESTDHDRGHGWRTVEDNSAVLDRVSPVQHK
jgi:hypothetical protein